MSNNVYDIIEIGIALGVKGWGREEEPGGGACNHISFSVITLIPKGFSQWNISLTHLVDESGGSIEINLTAPVYVTSVPLEVFDAEDRPVFKRRR